MTFSYFGNEKREEKEKLHRGLTVTLHHWEEDVGTLPTPPQKAMFDHQMLPHVPLKRHEGVYSLARAWHEPSTFSFY
jgi:hypothetical protein